MRIMAAGRIIILSALFAQALSAPSGCIESCNIHRSSYQSLHTLGGYQNHANSFQDTTKLNEQDYGKPGNWTERNQYETEDGHGKVHEERGQYVDTSKKVRYYKKNFTSSYDTGRADGGVELDQLSRNRGHDAAYVASNQHLDSRGELDQAGSTSVTKESGYSRVHSQQTQSSSRRIDDQSERLEDFGEYSGHSQVSQRVVPGSQTSGSSPHVETTPDNWSRVDSYKTDGGHGRVYEEEGQYVTGPKRVRYYKKNYTSNYSASSGVPQDSTLQNLHHEMRQNLNRQLDDLRRELHQVSNIGHVAAASHADSSRSLTQETVGFHSDDLQTAESDTYRQQLTHHRVPSTGTLPHYTDQQQPLVDTRHQVPYTSPTGGTYGTESQRTYQSHETYVSRVHPTHQPTHLAHLAPVSPDYIQRPVSRDGYQSSLHNVHTSGHHAVDDTQRAIVSGIHQSNAAHNQMFAENTQRVYQPSPDYGTYPSRRGQTSHYEEHWSSSGRTGGNVHPDYGVSHGAGQTGRAHYDRDAYNEHLGRYHTAAQGYNSHTQTSGSTYNPGYRVSSGQLVTGSLDVGHAAHSAVDCTEETHQHYEQESRHHRKYKRDDHHGVADEHQVAEHDDLTQQSEQTSGQLEFGQQTVGSQQLEDLTQQNDQFTQQTEGSDDFTQQTMSNQHLEDPSQQSEGHLEFGQQVVGNQHLDDLTQQSAQFEQQTAGSDDFPQQSMGKTKYEQHSDDTDQLEHFTQQTEQLSQRTERSDDTSQQTSGKLGFGQQTVGQQHLEDFTQNEQFTQQTEDNFADQTSGKLEFGQHTVGNEHLEDLTQQTEQFEQQPAGSDDFTQQTDDKLELGQQTVGNQELEDFTQQSEEFGQQTTGPRDFTQQTSGKLEFGQHVQLVDKLSKPKDDYLGEFNHHKGDFTQQTEGSDEITQQTMGHVEFGQQTQQPHRFRNQHMEDFTQQNEDLTQQVGGFHDLTQQSMGHLEFGQQTQQPHGSGNQHMEDFTQQNEDMTQQVGGFHDLTQQSTGHLEFGQQTQEPHKFGNQHMEDFTQQNEDFTQKNGESRDLTQQTMGQLEFGQQMQQPHRSGNQHMEDFSQQDEDLTQQVGGFHDLTQQSMGHLEFGQQTQEPHKFGNQHMEDLTQQNEDLTQQTMGHLEFGQQMQQPHRSGNQHMEDFTQQNEDLTQQIGGFHDLTQQSMGHLEFGQQTQQPHGSGNQHMEDFTRQDEDLTQQVGGFHDLTQQSMGHLEFGQQTQEPHKFGNQHMEDLTQQNEDLTQQTMGQLEFGQQMQQPHRSGNQHMEDFTRQDEDLTQQVGGFHDLTQQSMGHLEFGQQTQEPHKFGNQHMEDLTQQNEDLTQQSMGHLEFGQQTQQPNKFGNQHREDLTQQNKDLTQQVGGFHDLTQQTMGHLEFGQQREQQWKPDKPIHGTEYLEHPSQRDKWNKRFEWQSEQMPQKTDFDQDFTQQSDHDQQSVIQPASKPKPRPRYHNSNPSGANVDVFKPIEINPKDNVDGRDVQHGSHTTYPKFNYQSSRIEDSQSQGSHGFDNQKENIDRLHWVHKSNDATVGLQWHYTYHPSDLTNVESSHNIYYPQYNSMSQQTEQAQKPIDFSQQETQNKYALETSTLDNQFDQNSDNIPSQVIPLQHSEISQQTQLDKQSSQASEYKPESRILEAFGGGPYDGSHNDDIYKRVTPNPSATLPPIYSEEAWDIREKPRGEAAIPWLVARTLSPVNKPATDKTEDITETATQTIGTTVTEAPPSFWTRVGNKITNTYDKAKEKAREFFG